MGKHIERVFKKNSQKPNTASHNNASWYTDTVGFLEHSHSVEGLYYKGPILQKIILFFGGSLPYILWSTEVHKSLPDGSKTDSKFNSFLYIASTQRTQYHWVLFSLITEGVFIN